MQANKQTSKQPNNQLIKQTKTHKQTTDHANKQISKNLTNG